jgi:hypothetical protein
MHGNPLTQQQKLCKQCFTDRCLVIDFCEMLLLSEVRTLVPFGETLSGVEAGQSVQLAVAAADDFHCVTPRCWRQARGSEQFFGCFTKRRRCSFSSGGRYVGAAVRGPETFVVMIC